MRNKNNESKTLCSYLQWGLEFRKLKNRTFKVWFLNGKEFGFRMIGTVQKPNFKMVALS